MISFSKLLVQLFLNLIVQYGLNIVEDVIAKICNGIKYIKRLVPQKKKFYEITSKSFQLNTEKKLHCDVYKRWNLIYLMLGHALYFKNVLQYLTQRDKNFKFAFFEEEWKKISILYGFLKVFYEIICM